MNDYLITVIIPSLNRADLLPYVIQSIRGQTLAPDKFEIIVVDNGSTDNTKEVIEALNRGHAKPIRYIYEPRRGLHWARHAAARAARADLLCYTDDDAEVSPQWLELLTAAFQDPRVGAAGGPIIVRWRTPPPDWVPPLGSFGNLDWGPAVTELHWPQAINGANFSFRKKILFDVGGFNPDTAVADKLVGDGERGLCRKIFGAGWKIVYIPKAIVYHVQDGHTITLPSMRHRYAQQGRFIAYEDYKLNRHSLGLLHYLAVKYFVLFLARKAVNGLWPRNKKHYRHAVKSADFLARTQYYTRMALSRTFRRLVLRENWLSADDSSCSDPFNREVIRCLKP